MKPTTLAEPEVAVSANRSLDSRLANCFAPLTSQAAAASLVRSNAQYAQLAGDYDRATPRIEALREIAHRSLRLAPGDTVIDVGCGTGKSLDFLSRTVGPKGRVIAIEPCREMMAVARDRVARGAMKNVELIESEVTADALPAPARSIDALLFMFTHDVLQSSASIETLLLACRPGARIALAGGKLFRGPLSILNPWVEWRQRQYCTTFENYDAPWRKLFASDALINTRVHPKYMGIAYIAYGERAA
jgi:ubiquinone/menaquinone biosynthesis C-methylase UbiE